MLNLAAARWNVAPECKTFREILASEQGTVATRADAWNGGKALTRRH
jgi:hypothetical protein